MASLIHDLRMLDFDNGIRFLKVCQDNFSETLIKQNYLRFPLVRGSQTEPPSLYGWVLKSVQIDGLTWLGNRRLKRMTVL
jgi:hypothetical protein